MIISNNNLVENIIQKIYPKYTWNIFFGRMNDVTLSYTGDGKLRVSHVEHLKLQY